MPHGLDTGLIKVGAYATGLDAAPAGREGMKRAAPRRALAIESRYGVLEN